MIPLEMPTSQNINSNSKIIIFYFILFSNYFVLFIVCFIFGLHV